MRDEDVARLRPGDRVNVTGTLCEYYTFNGAVLVEVKEKNCTQRFWMPTSAVAGSDPA